MISGSIEDTIYNISDLLQEEEIKIVPHQLGSQKKAS